MTEAVAPRLYLDAALRPRRSMSPRAVVLLMAPVLAVNVIFAVVFTLMGGAFVPPFLGLDVLGLGLAFWLNFRAARRIERIRVTADAIEVTRETPKQTRRVWRSAPVFTRIELSHPGRHASRLRLFCKGKGVTLGAALAPAEREAFAERLKSAVSAAKAERW
ncbi:MAG TPA: DUF2244 domain-containing protein [Caulobacteraceae bacterium]|jgi:uncharacterized membrane protein